MNCPNCSAKLSEDDVFCYGCGTCIKADKFSDSNAVKKQEKTLQALIRAVNEAPHNTVTWNDMVDKYVAVSEKLDVLCQNSTQTEQIERIRKKLGAFIERCQSPEFHIAFVGTIKAGKSTLINALLGRNLASTSVTPETAVLTKFRYSEKSYVKIKFYNAAQWEQLWASVSKNAEIFMKEYNALNGDGAKNSWIGHADITKQVEDDALESEIEIWTSSKHVEHYFVREVEIGLPSFPYKNGVIFVDTPGLDDAVAYRSNVTREYIDRANAVFTCVKSDALTGPELSILYRVFANTSYNTDKVYVIGTQWDSLNDPSKDWITQKKEWVKYLTTESCYSSKESAERNIIHVAAYLQNLCREFGSLSKDEMRSLGSIAFKFDIYPTDLEERISELMEMSNVEAIHSKIQQDIVGKTEEYLISDITENYKDICSEIRKYFGEVRAAQAEILAASGEKSEEIRARYEAEKQKLEEVKNYRQQLVDTLDLVREDTTRRVNELCKQLKEMAK